MAQVHARSRRKGGGRGTGDFRGFPGVHQDLRGVPTEGGVVGNDEHWAERQLRRTPRRGDQQAETNPETEPFVRANGGQMIGEGLTHGGW